MIKENIPSDSFFLIKSGCAKVTKENRLIGILGAGSPIGELSFIDKGLPSATATAEEDSILIKIPSEAFDNLMNRDKDIAYKVYRSIASALCQKLRDTNEWLFTMDWLHF
ncbi:MAG: cyclic nucleotide-binding domain-containing protein [Nitrospirae bacterium]|nr:cyclic nucleotide-binding domain-containing protein [Nitrospirota bacterium]